MADAGAKGSLSFSATARCSAVAAGVQDQRVKAVVHAGVGGVALQRERVVGQQAVARLQAGLQVALQLARHAVFGHQARGHALQVAAHGNRIGHFARGELAHQVFAGVAGLDQALLLQRDEGAAHRRARCAKALGQLLLRQALAGLEGAAQNQVRAAASKWSLAGSWRELYTDCEIWDTVFKTRSGED